MGGFLVRKLVKPAKVFCSWPPDQGGLDQILPSQTEAQVWATATGVLGKSDAAVRQKLGRLDPPDRVFDQMAELLPLLVGNRGVEVLNLNQPLADEDDLGDLGNACHPGIAD
jgi:hypothetical protein